MTAPGVHDVWLHSLASDLGRQLQNEITCVAHFFFFFLRLHLSQSQKPWIFMHTFNIIVIYSASFSISGMMIGSGWNWRVHLYYSQKISACFLQTELLNCLFPQCVTLSTTFLLELSWASQSDFSLRNYNSADYSTSIQRGEGVSRLWVGSIYRANTGTVF